ncbi:MAG: hypothetical protein ABIC04_04965 [Nanoarchaeota archaeon]
MKNFKTAITEIYTSLNSILIFEDLLSGVLIFLIGYILLLLFNLNVFYSILPAVIYLVYEISKHLNKNLNNDKLKIVEDVYPNLNEKIRTAADNTYMENPVTDELQSEVLKDLRNVRLSSFFSTKKTTYKLFACIIICFLIVIVALLNFKLADFGIKFKKDPGYLTGGFSNESSDSDIASAGSAGSDNIFGEESVATLGSEQLNIELNSLSFELTNVRKETDIPISDFEQSFPDEVEMLQNCDSDCVLENDIPVDQQELVKKYFIKLAET